ncbi:hypothetical protein GCM10025767_28630 [Thalassotalea piscium]
MYCQFINGGFMANSNTAKSTNVNDSVNKNSSPIAEKVTDTLHSSVDSLGESVSKAEKNVRQAATASSETLAKKQAKLKSSWDHSQVKKYAVENPVATAGIAFAAGALLTSLLKRK